MPVQVNSFEFTVKSLSSTLIGDAIADYCNIEYTDSSNLPSLLSKSSSNSNIYGKTGNVSYKLFI